MASPTPIQDAGIAKKHIYTTDLQLEDSFRDLCTTKRREKLSNHACPLFASLTVLHIANSASVLLDEEARLPGRLKILM